MEKTRRKLGSFRIPLLNGGQPQAHLAANPLGALNKPERRLGAGFIDDRTATDQCVVLCDDCITKYWGFWTRTSHRPNWGYYFTGNCHGCSRRYMLCILFVPDPNFYKVLADHHGRAPSPKRTIFRFPWRT